MGITVADAKKQPIIIVKDSKGDILKIITPKGLQVGLEGNPGTLVMKGGQAIASRVININQTSSPVNITTDDIAVFINNNIATPNQPVNVYLPTPPAEVGQLHIVKDFLGNASVTMPITILTSDGSLIDGAPSQSIAVNYGAIMFVWTGNAWVSLALGASGASAGAPNNLTYVTINHEGLLANSRQLQGTASQIVLTDGGAGSTISISLADIVTAGTFTNPSSVTIDSKGRVTSITAGASAYAPLGAAYVTVGNDATLTNERAITAGTGISIVDGGPNSTITLAINNNVVATITGSRFTGPVIAAGGLSGSLQRLSDGVTNYIVGSGEITVTTQSNGQIVVSGPSDTGGSGDPNASYVVMSLTASLPNDRALSGSWGIRIVDAGAGANVTLFVDNNKVATTSGSVFTGPTIFQSGLSGSLQQTSAGNAYIVPGANITVLTNSLGQVVITGLASGSGGGTVDPNAPIVVTFPTSSVPSGRTLTAGPGISVQDFGAGQPVVVSLNAIASQSALAYQGHCTGSLNFGTHTAWTDLITTIPGNWFDDITNGITRSGTTFTVNATGYYHFHAFFNAVQPSQYIAFRLSGSNGTILQRTTWQNGGQPPMVMDGIVQLNSGSSFKLQFYDSGGSAWGPSDPIGTAPDQENMRTGDVSIFRIADPLTVNATFNQVVTSSSPGGWITIYDVDYTTQPAQTFTGNASVTIAGITYTQLNPGNAAKASIVPGLGVQYINGASNDIFGGTFSVPVLTAPVQSFFPQYSLPDSDIRLWFWISQEVNETTNFEGNVEGILRTGAPTSENITNKKGFFAGSLQYNPQININATNYVNVDITPGYYATTNIIVLEYKRGGRFATWYVGSGSTIGGQNVWPTAQSLSFQGFVDVNPSSELFDQLPITGSGDVSMFLGCTSTTGRNVTESFARFRVDYLNATGSFVNVITNPLQLVSASLTSSVNIPFSPTYVLLAQITSSMTDVIVLAKASGLVNGSNTVYTKVTVDGQDVSWLKQYCEVVNSGAGFGTAIVGAVQGLASGTHTWAFLSTKGSNANTPSINPTTDPFQQATLTLMNLTGSAASGGSGNVQAFVTGTWRDPGNTFVTTGSVSIDASNRTASQIGTDVFFFVSGTIDTPPGTNRKVAVIGGDLVVSGSVTAKTGFTGSLQVLTDGVTPYLVGAGGAVVSTSSNGQVVINASGGGGGGTGISIFGQAAYQGFVTSSVWWLATGSWQPFTGALPDNTVTDIVTQSISRAGSVFTFLNGGYYYLHSSFNAYGSDAYISLRWNGGPFGVALERSTYRTTPADQNLVILDGVFSASIGSTFTLEYVSSGSVFAWTGSNPLPSDGPMHTGNITIFLLPSNQVPGVIIETGSYVPTDANDYLWWPLTDTQGPYALNYGSAGAIGNLTASSGNVHFNQVGPGGGPIKTSIGPNTAGQTSNYLGIVNTATQPTPSGSNITVSAWFRPEGATTSNHQKIVVKSYFNTTATWNSPFIAIDLGLAGTSDGKMEFGLNGLSVSGPTTVSSASCCTPNEWNHAGMSYDGAIFKCYLNGVLIYKFASTGLIDYSQNGWWAIGGNQAIPGTEYFQGQIADVRVANTVRSDAWFTQVWASGRPDALQAFTLTGSGGTARAPIYSIPLLTAMFTTVQGSGTKDTLGMNFFNPQMVQNFGGVSRRYFYRAIMAPTTGTVLYSDLYDYNGVILGFPAPVLGSVLTASNASAFQNIQADLTSVLQNVSGSGIFVARSWVLTGSSLAGTCTGARLEVEYT